MKKILFVALVMVLMGIGSFAYADEYATTDSGIRVLLKADSTWEFVVTEGETISKWRIRESYDAMDDCKKIAFSLKAERSSICLTIRYNKGHTDLYVNWDDYLGDNNNIIIRFDKESSYLCTWGGSTSDTSLFFREDFHHENVISFIRHMFRSETLTLRVTPYKSGPLTAVFDIRGLEDEAMKYKDDLDW